jgi:hypothetical protein
MFLSDLVFLEDGNPDHVKEYGEGVINFEKRRMVAAVINQIQRLQQVSHWICTFCWLFICLSPMQKNRNSELYRSKYLTFLFSLQDRYALERVDEIATIIENMEVTLDENQLFQLSLELEPRVKS